MPFGAEVGLGPGHIVLDGDPAPPKGAQQRPHFSVHVYCGQMAGCIRIPLSTEVGLDLGDIVLDGDSAPLTERGTAAPNTVQSRMQAGQPASVNRGPCLLW